MTDAERVELVINHLEPGVYQGLRQCIEDMRMSTEIETTASLYSIAISLKRIADGLSLINLCGDGVIRTRDVS